MRMRISLFLLFSLVSVPAFSFQGGDGENAAGAKQTVVPGAGYNASWLHTLLLGSNWRDLWTTPIRVPVLDLEAFAGGIRPTKAGGGNQTRSLRFEDAQGNEFVFRLVDKAGQGLPLNKDGNYLDVSTADHVMFVGKGRIVPEGQDNLPVRLTRLIRGAVTVTSLVGQVLRQRLYFGLAGN